MGSLSPKSMPGLLKNLNKFFIEVLDLEICLFRSQLCLFLAVQPLTNHLTFLCLGFPMFKMVM